jgi:hypothetical protein
MPSSIDPRAFEVTAGRLCVTNAPEVVEALMYQHTLERAEEAAALRYAQETTPEQRAEHWERKARDLEGRLNSMRVALNEERKARAADRAKIDKLTAEVDQLRKRTWWQVLLEN